MARTTVPGHQVTDASIKDADIATDAAIGLSKLALVSSLTEKTTPADADVFPGADSAASNVWKKFSWSNIKAALKSFFDGLYSKKKIFVKKASDDLVNNSTSYTDDSELNGFSLEANSTYKFIFIAHVTANTTSKFKCRFSSSVNMSFEFFCLGNTSAAGSMRLTSSRDLVTSSSGIMTANPQMDGGIVVAIGTITTTSAGTLKIQFAQDVAQVFDTKLLSGSILTLEKL